MKRVCPICSHPEKKLLYRQNFGTKAVALMANYDVVVCRECGFVYADNIPSQKDFNRYYATMSKYEFDYSSGVVADSYMNHFVKLAEFLTPHIKDKNAKILDMGCSTGALLSILKSQGYTNLLGVDPSPLCVKTVKGLYGIEAEAGNISDFNGKKKFDVIILSAVLEHLVDFQSSMAKISALLKSGGLLLVEIPNAARFDSYVFTPFQQFSIEHINYFSPDSLRNLLLKFSFKIVETKDDENRVNQTIDPDIFAIARKSDKSNFKIVRDNICEPRIKNYIKLSSEIDSKVKKIIKEKLSDRDKIIIWGVGTHTQRLIGSGLDLSRVLFFVDSNARYRGKKINGIEIKSPNDIKENAPILISTYSYQDEVIHQIKKILKLSNEIIRIY